MEREKFEVIVHNLEWKKLMTLNHDLFQMNMKKICDPEFKVRSLGKEKREGVGSGGNQSKKAGGEISGRIGRGET